MSAPSEIASPAGPLWSGYAPPAGAYDELLTSEGHLRPHWQAFVAGLDALGRQELVRRWDQARRLLRDNGITYNVHGDPQGHDRPWNLDALPLVVAAPTWRTLQAGISQRAQLINRVLADVYGPQELLKTGRLPPEIVYANPGFLRPVHDVTVPDDCYVHLYAADLARATDGGWWVLGDRTQAPAGMGYSLENRLVISRMLPQVFHECRVQRLASFFQSLRQSLERLALHNRDNPRIVLLTAGPRAETYFEDAYLARYLSFTLVEGGDLAVRNNTVYLKTLGGLLQVDVVFRRLSDRRCDPLELDGDSVHGVAGLTQAARAGNVALANALGSGAAEAPALMAFLPGLCQDLLGEELILPSVATWWCGQEEALRFVLAHLDRLVIKPAFGRPRTPVVFGEQLTDRERARLAARIKARPRDYVAQEQVVRSVAPVWVEGGLQSWHLALRAYATTSPEGYQVMEGGLVRLSAALDPLDPSLAFGEGSKDVWILADGPVNPLSLLPAQGEPVRLRRSGSDLPSRVADHLYWLGRQTERAEGGVRLLRSILLRLSSESDPGGLPELPVLLHALSDEGPQPSGAIAEGTRIHLPAVQRELVSFLFDPRRPGSLRNTLATLDRVAGEVRDRISIDSFRILNRLDRELQVPPPDGRVELADVLATLGQMIIDLSAFAGLAMESMTRGQGWRFLDMGRRIERALHMIHLVRSTLVLATRQEAPLLEALLEVADSSMTYRTRYLTTLQLAPVLDLLLTDESNPRSLAFQLAALAEHVERLPRDESQPTRTGEQRLMISAQASLQLADVEQLVQVDADGVRIELDRLLSRLGAQLPNLSDRLSHRYLVHASPEHQLSDITPDKHL